MYQDYLHFSEEELIADVYFQEWVRFPDRSNRTFWEGFIKTYPQNKALVLSAKSFLENLTVQAVQPSAAQVEASLAESLKKIAALESSFQPDKNTSGRRRLYLSLGAAAVFVLAVITTTILLRNSGDVTIEAVADTGQIQTLVLPDSSVVTLNAGSRLTYKANMQHDSFREVWLDGEAFFDVKQVRKKNLPQRFIVHTGDMEIEVIGTTFNVKKVGGYTNVSLNTGRIRIGLKDEPNATIELLPGDFVRYSSREKHIVKKQVKPELFTVWKEEKLSLDNMTVAEIARLLEDAYGYTVNIQDNQLAETRLSGTLQLKDESTLLEALAFTLDIDIIKKDSVLYLQLKNKQ